jgi:RHS repeat-associated protein
VRQKFGSKERDAETGLDYFVARYYSSVQGRFTVPDSFGGSGSNPQTLNLYAYVRNNPLKYVDPTGHFAQDPNTLNKEKDEISPISDKPMGGMAMLNGWKRMIQTRSKTVRYRWVNNPNEVISKVEKIANLGVKSGIPS